MKKLLLLLEKPLRLQFAPPIDELMHFRLQRQHSLPQALCQFLSITNGLEVLATQTVFYTAADILEANSQVSPFGLEVAMFNFGDPIYMNATGELIQIDHEEGVEFLRWPSLEAFLKEEVGGLK